MTRDAWTKAYSHARWRKVAIVLHDSSRKACHQLDSLGRLLGIDALAYNSAVASLVARQKCDRLRLPRHLRASTRAFAHINPAPMCYN